MTPSTSWCPSAIRAMAFSRTSSFTGRDCQPLAFNSPRVPGRAMRGVLPSIGDCARTLPGTPEGPSGGSILRLLVPLFTIPLAGFATTRFRLVATTEQEVSTSNQRPDADAAGALRRYEGA